MHPLLFKIKRFYRKEKLPDPLAYLYKWFDCTPKGVFQVGASSGQEIKYFAEHGVNTGIFVEPLPDAFQRLKMAASAYDGFYPVNAVCLDIAGKTCDFYVSGSNGASSSTLKPTGVLSLHPEVKFELKPVSLKSTTVNQIVADFKERGLTNVIAPIDLLYLDTQGAELSVLKGADELLKQVLYVFAEVSHGGLYENDVGHNELTEYLEGRGFFLAFLYMNKTRWGDALYVHNSLFEK